MDTNVYGKDDRNGMISKREVEKTHSEYAMDLFKQGNNCSQAVFLAFCDEYGMDKDTAKRISSSFGGGMGRLREVCGAVSGMFMVAGLIYGSYNPTDQVSKTKHYKRIQELGKEFEEINQSIICRELLGLGKGKDSPVPELRTAEYYKKRPCVELVGIAADIMERYIANHKE
jgi:C_GCAxxG_C_C family probable redox protein